MSKAGQLKKQWDFKANVPRCDNCISFRESYVRLTENSNTKRVNQHCDRGGFTVSRNSVCKYWTDTSLMGKP